MAKVADVMTRDVQAIAPGDTMRRAAELMDELNVGALPVCDGTRLKGVVTDRDIVVRAVSAGKDASRATISETRCAGWKGCRYAVCPS